MKLENDHFRVSLNEQDGCMESVILQADPHGMNWLLDGEAEQWLPSSKRWGAGFLVIGQQKYRWSSGKLVSSTPESAVYTYCPKYTIANTDETIETDKTAGVDDINGINIPTIKLTVHRQLAGEVLEEQFIFHNDSEQDVLVDEIGIYSTFYDVYPVVEGDVLSHRAHMHIWAGGGVSYIKGVRMSGKAPHLAMITTMGDVEEYQVEEKSTSNSRGAVVLAGKQIQISSGQSYTVKRLLFAYSDETDFHRKVAAYSGYPYLKMGLMAVPVGETVQITVEQAGGLEKLVVGEHTYTPDEGETIAIPLDKPGLTEGMVFFKGKQAVIRWYGLPAIDQLLAARAAFIVAHQQVNDEQDLRDGAFLPYDWEYDRLMKVEDIEGRYASIPDRNDARERIGMGAYLASYYRLHNAGEADEAKPMQVQKGMQALARYSQFVQTKLIAEDGGVWDSCYQEESARYYHNLQAKKPDMMFRGFNYFFMGNFLLSMYRFTHDNQQLALLIRVLDYYFKRFAPSDLSFGLNPQEMDKTLKEAGMNKEADWLRQQFREKAAAFIHMGDQYEPSEVNYEQSTIAGVLMFLLDMYRLEGDSAILAGARKHMELLEGFDGCQPDYRLHGVGLRHWDGFWFGREELWGDTMPHHWSTLSAYAYYRYYQITGDPLYELKARQSLHANLSLFHEDGSADYTYIYPYRVNGKAAHRPDPLSNDQDWALYYYVELMC